MRSKWSHHLFLVIFFPGEFVQILTRIAEVFLTPSLGAVSHRPLVGLCSNCRNVKGDKEGKEEVSGRAHTDLSFFFLSFISLKMIPQVCLGSLENQPPDNFHCF